jgi:hypothetical protein
MQRQPEITEGWDAPLLSGAGTAAITGLAILHDDADYDLAGSAVM